MRNPLYKKGKTVYHYFIVLSAKKCALCFSNILFLLGINLFSAGCQDKEPPPSRADADIVILPVQAVIDEPSRGEQVMRALAAAFPDRINPAVFRNGDWAVQVYGEWFCYAEGRLLPEEIRTQTAAYSSLPFYNYVVELPPWTDPSDEDSDRMTNMAANRSRNTVRRSEHFYNALWRASNREEAYDRVKQIRFVGYPIMVHYSILGPLSLVEERILREAATKPHVRQWINDLNRVESWYWRDIADSANRSLHSYGVAIDLLPASTRGLETYWLWTSAYTEWWKVPYSRRYHPPDEVIKAFEAYGFIWGGKWTVYDTMHFEYRPEILILSNIPMAQYR